MSSNHIKIDPRPGRFFQEMLDASPAITAMLGQDGLIVYVNRAVEKALDYRTEEWIGKYIFPILHPEDIPLLVGKLQNPDGRSAEIRLRSKSGEWRYFSVRMVSAGDTETDGSCILSAADITEYRARQDILTENYEKFKEMTESQPHIVCETDPEFRLIYANHKCCEILEIAEETLSKAPLFTEFLHPDDREKAMEHHRSLICGGESKAQEYQIRSLSGKLYPALLFSCCLNRHDSASGVLITILDLSDYCIHIRMPDESFYTEHHIVPSERKVIGLILQGKKIREVARQLLISESTVKTHISNIYRKLNITTREDLIRAVNETEAVQQTRGPEGVISGTALKKPVSSTGGGR